MKTLFIVSTIHTTYDGGLGDSRRIDVNAFTSSSEAKAFMKEATSLPDFGKQYTSSDKCFLSEIEI